MTLYSFPLISKQTRDSLAHKIKNLQFDYSLHPHCLHFIVPAYDWKINWSSSMEKFTNRHGKDYKHFLSAHQLEGQDTSSELPAPTRLIPRQPSFISSIVATPSTPTPEQEAPVSPSAPVLCPTCRNPITLSQQEHSFDLSQLQKDQQLQESHPHIDQAKANRQIVTELLASSKYKINIEDLLVKIVTSRNIKQEDTIAVILALLGCASIVPVKEPTESEENTENSETTDQDKDQE